MADEMNNIVQYRGRLKSSLTRALQYADDPPADCTYDQIINRLERLETVWQEFNRTTNDLYKFRDAEDYVDPNIDFESYEEKFLAARGNFLYLKRKYDRPAEHSHQVDAISKLADQQSTFLERFSSTSPEKYNDLPKINIPPFSGQYKDWPCFQDLFTSSIDSKPGLSDTQKFYHLKSLLKDDAAKLIQHIPVTEVAYKTAWSRLNERYDRPRHIVNSFIDTFMALPSTSIENGAVLRKISDFANEIIRGLGAIDKEDRDCWLIYILLSKIDPDSRRRWIHESRDNSSPSIVEFFYFLDSRCEELELYQRKPAPNTKNSSAPKPIGVSTKTFVTADISSNCLKCKATDHVVSKCPMFLQLSVDDRRCFAKQSALCFNCLKIGHTSYNCKSKFRCKECHRRHHTLVHANTLATPKSDDTSISSSAAAESNGTTWSTVANVAYPVTSNESSDAPLINQKHNIILPTAMVNVRNSQGQYVTCRVLLDCASELLYISESCVRRLGLERAQSKIVVSGISSVKAETTRGCCCILMKSKFSSDSLDICVHILTRITSPLPNVTFDASFKDHLKGVPLADPTFNISSPIDILLGAQHVWNIFTFNKLFDRCGNTIAVSSIFGWVVTCADSPKVCTTVACVSVVDIDKSLRSFWEIEETDYTPQKSDDDTFVEDHFQRTHSRNNDGRYVVQLPFKREDVRFSNTLQGALSRFYAVERRLQRNNTLKKQYVNFMREYLRLDHMRELQGSEIAVQDGRVFYMPHHPVLGDKIRVVFDGSFQDANGVSLNSTLHVGPCIQRDLFAVCLRFRFHRYVFSADIVKMFRQIWVSSCHRNYQRIVWRESPLEQIKHYQLCTVTYGTTCAPFLSVRVLEQLAKDYRVKHPVAAQMVDEDFYVDDVLTGASSEEELFEKRDDLVKLLSYAGLELRKWVSNCQRLTLSPPDEDVYFKSPNDELKKVLGVFWKPGEDILAYNISLQNDAVATKRQVLSDVSRIFDPLGLLAPIVVNFKILFQELWLCNLEWDDPLPVAQGEWWSKCRKDLHNIQRLTVPRYVCNNDISFELHGFSDASIKAYSAVVYVRFTDDAGNPQVILVAAKTRVAPLKQISLPRLELCGALLLTRLLKRITSSLAHHSVTVRAWCDSNVVLSWLSLPPVRLKTFVANRTSEILETLPRTAWNHVRSKENPADCASRGMLASKLCQFDLWWKGPSWLSDNLQYYAVVNTKYYVEPAEDTDALVEMKSQATTFLCIGNGNKPFCELLERVSRWTKLVRIMCYVLRFIRNTRNLHHRLFGAMTFQEIKYSTLVLLRLSQYSFNDDRKNLHNKSPVNHRSKLFKLAPYIDSDGLIRVGGRIRNSEINTETKHPIVLPKECRITQLILEDAHERHLHPGVSALFVIIRQKYWVLGARNLIRKLTHKCIRCFRQRQLSTQQLMADLPSVRVRQAFPFENSGCDYAGPFMLKLYSGRNARKSKAYICLFVCMTTSAIHLELVSDLSTECFLAALRRFISRRGKCRQIFSDNGRNFLGASRALNEMRQMIISQTHNEIVSASLAEDGIQWTYIPPHAPHWGGIWESAVRSVKLHLKRVIMNNVLTFEQMNTLLTQIEAVVNSRPLYATPDSECDYLSPAHFLIGRPYTMVPEGDLSTVNLNKLSYWQHVQNMYQGFWRRWHQEYLTSMQQRPKWNLQQVNVAVGNIVVVKDPKMPPGAWPMARVIATYPGNDGVVRVVRLRTSHAEMTRPIRKIVVLPIV